MSGHEGPEGYTSYDDWRISVGETGGTVNLSMGMVGTVQLESEGSSTQQINEPNVKIMVDLKGGGPAHNEKMG